jgi:hypothetical protein
MLPDKQISSIIKRLERLEKAVFTRPPVGDGRHKTQDTSRSASAKIDFDLNERHFVKTYARGMSGPKKFTLLLAFMTQGKVGENIEVSAIRSRWNKMKSSNLLGYPFNVNYPNAAKTSGWVDTKKYGTYCLCKSWQQIFATK